MNLKLCVRKGLLGESINYKELITFGKASPEHIIVILEGKGRRKLNLLPNRYLYESYFPNNFIGVEDILLKKTRIGGAGVFPGSHYILWDKDDFLNAIQVYPELVKRIIASFSRRIRLYDAREKMASPKIKQRNINPSSDVIDPNDPDIENNSLYNINFTYNKEFPQDIIDNFSASFGKGDYILKQGDEGTDIFLILSGEATITRNIIQKSHSKHSEEEIDFLGAGDFIGEMSMFDGLPRSANVIANSDLLVLKFSKKSFNLIFSLHPKWSLKIMNVLANRIDQRRTEFERLPMGSVYKI